MVKGKRRSWRPQSKKKSSRQFSRIGKDEGKAQQKKKTTSEPIKLVPGGRRSPAISNEKTGKAKVANQNTPTKSNT